MEERAITGVITALSNTGKLIIAENSGHAIHLYRPELVTRSITEVVAAARARSRYQRKR
jgi:pimeloyl-ACP methyl ester carboxylesterase